MLLPPRMQVGLLSSVTDIQIDGFDGRLRPLDIGQVQVEINLPEYCPSLMIEGATVPNCQQAWS